MNLVCVHCIYLTKAGRLVRQGQRGLIIQITQEFPGKRTQFMVRELSIWDFARTVGKGSRGKNNCECGTYPALGFYLFHNLPIQGIFSRSLGSGG